MNAAGRMADAGEIIELFLTGDPARARAIAEQLNRLNQERQQAEAEMLRSIDGQCLATPATSGDRALVFSGPGWHRGVVGIVASRLVDRFHRPVVVLSVDPETGLAHGSGRSIPAFHLLEALESMHEIFTQFGGHRQAAGVTLAAEHIPAFRSRLNAHALARLTEEDLVRVLEIDALLDVPEVDEACVAEVLSLAPFGYGNPSPVFAVCGAEVAAPPTILKEKHLRLTLRQKGRNLKVMAWNAADRVEQLRGRHQHRRGHHAGRGPVLPPPRLRRLDRRPEGLPAGVTPNVRIVLTIIGLREIGLVWQKRLGADGGYSVVKEQSVEAMGTETSLASSIPRRQPVPTARPPQVVDREGKIPTGSRESHIPPLLAWHNEGRRRQARRRIDPRSRD